ncbi:purine or other phosphorylase family 1 [Thermodesulfobacterium geofontis OPF15]|uniref:Uridine phosphorylase n=1 Tax=Thermodesulfobacterium geofontis (strain OPF15) TaxID=795359 RepID=F8C2Q2_THEGP|nr:purine or other phosphorylase 1 [Thermodesulfobacterium geofontis]AEH23455.1 purine or other phosphorylase family 1 [Thermodesulfobacterium geofontis OPF15]
MFLPKLKIKTGKRSVIFFTLPEWNHAKEKILTGKNVSFLNLQIKYNEKSLILGPVIGAPFLSIVLEVLKSLGIEEIIGIGWAGKLSVKINRGDLFLPLKAYAKEGTSNFYFPKKRVFNPDKTLFERIEKEMIERSIDFKKGSIISVDAPFVFERKKVYLEKWRKKIEALDMETSALFSIGISLQIKVMVLHFIIDEVGKFFKKRPEEEIKIKRQKVFELLKDFLDYKI